MPKEFLDLANGLRCSDNPGNNVILSRKSTQYNSKKTKGNCEICNKKAQDMHHMNPQKLANKEGFIGTFHKNHKANLMTVCKKCHDKFTRNDTVHRRVKTTQGYKTVEINM
jgi:DNA mismatch repair protein MutS